MNAPLRPFALLERTLLAMLVACALAAGVVSSPFRVIRPQRPKQP